MPKPDKPRRGGESAEIAELLREQRRLRNEVRRLSLAIHQDGSRNGKNDGAEKNRGEDQQKESPKKETPNKEKEESPKQDDRKKEDQPNKPPLRLRVVGWTREHPLSALLLVAGVIVLVFAAWLLLRYLSSYVDTDDAEVDGHINQIGSRITGTVIGVYTENNRSVVKDQTLVDLDPRDYRTALAQAEANLAQAEAALQAQSPNVPITQTTESTNVATADLEIANAEAALQAARQSYQAALADLQQVEATAHNAALEEQRYRRLADKEEVSREQYDQRATEATAQEANVLSRRAAADAARKTVDQRTTAVAQTRAKYQEATSNLPRQIAAQRASVATRQANVQAARAQLEQAQLNLGYCKISAPVDGIIGDKTVEVGQQVAPGQELLAITPISDLWVTANFKETQVREMHPGQSVTIHVDALGLDFVGFVQNMPGATGAKYSLLPPENATGNYVKVVQRLPVRIRFKPGQNAMDRLRPGMSVEPKVWIK